MNKTGKGKFKLLLTLFSVFFKIGAFTFGGGYAMIPLIKEEVVTRRKWLDDSDILDIIAIAESTPGPIAINSATFVGYRVCGFWGSFFSTVGIVLPSFVIIIALSFVINEFQSIVAVKYAFMGIRAGVLALLVKALVSMYKQCKKGAVAYIIMGFALVATVVASEVFNTNVVLYVIIGCAVCGLVSSLIARRKEK